MSSSVLRMRNVSDKCCGENQNRFYVQYFFFENFAVYGIIWKNIVQPNRPHENMAHVQCMLDN
jgi:hypothetical protein